MNKKKTFIELENPADLLMSKKTLEAQKENETEGQEGTGDKLETRPELKTKRVGLIMRQSTLDHAKQRAWDKHLSLNEYITQLIEADQA